MEKEEKMSEVVGIWFPKTRETTVRSYKNGERKEYAMILPLMQKTRKQGLIRFRKSMTLIRQEREN